MNLYITSSTNRNLQQKSEEDTLRQRVGRVSRKSTFTELLGEGGAVGE